MRLTLPTKPVCVCVYLLKRSKTCTCSWWPFSWWSLHELHEGISLHFGLIHFSSNWLLHDEQWKTNIFFSIWWAGGWSMTQKFPTNEDASDTTMIWFRDAGITYLLFDWGWHGDLVETLVMRVESFSQAVCFTIMQNGTSSFMTSAHDALVFVQVCNLWRVSDKVPQGRGDIPVQLLSRITLDYPNRMSNLQF